MTMPGMKGDELAERIRMIDKSIPIICVSGHHEPSSILDKLDGISRVSKPYLGDDLSDVVAHLLTKQE